jgi:hypothetical protein
LVAHPKIPKSEIDYIQGLQRAQADLQRAIGRGQPTLRDAAGNIVALDPASGTPLLVAQGHDVALNMSSTAGIDQGTLYVTDESGSQPRDLVAHHYYGDVGHPEHGNIPPYASVPYNVYSNTHGTHYGDTRNGKHWGDVDGFRMEATDFVARNAFFGPLSGDSYGVHHGPTDPQVQGPVGPVGPPGPKGFVIDNPKFNDRWLIHACTEAPHNGVEYWGTTVLTGGVARVDLPHYFEDLTQVESRTVHLTPILGEWRSMPKNLSLCATYPMNGQFGIVSNVDTSFEVCWLVHAVRKDLPDLLVEPRRAEIKVSGIGPYRTYSTVSNPDDPDQQVPDTVERPTELISGLWRTVGVEQVRTDQNSILLAQVQNQVRELTALVTKLTESMSKEGGE